MSTDEIYEVLNGVSNISGHEAELKLYLRSQLKRYDDCEVDPQYIAYEIAGLMSARAFVGVASDNPYMKVLEIAGQLELPEPHQSPQAGWDNLRQLIETLP